MADEAERPLVWLHGEIKSPPFSKAARIRAGALLGRLQQGERIGMPESRPMPGIGRETRKTWRVIYQLDADAVVVLEVFEKKTRQTRRHVLEICRSRLKRYRRATGNGPKRGTEG
jgi:phage-related protein